jgi:biuret amidohydrolase
MKKTDSKGSRNSDNNMSAGVRDEIVDRVERDYAKFKEDHTFKFPTWLYGPVKGKLLTVEVEDCPRFGDKAFVEFDSARTAFISVDMQVDFCGPKGYVDVMGYDLGLTSASIKSIM